MIFVMEIKALEQLHFKYCAELRECTARQVPGSSRSFGKEMCFTGYQAFRILNGGVFCSLFFCFFNSITHNITFFLIM